MSRHGRYLDGWRGPLAQFLSIASADWRVQMSSILSATRLVAVRLWSCFLKGRVRTARPSCHSNRPCWNLLSNCAVRLQLRPSNMRSMTVQPPMRCATGGTRLWCRICLIFSSNAKSGRRAPFLFQEFGTAIARKSHTSCVGKSYRCGHDDPSDAEVPRSQRGVTLAYGARNGYRRLSGVSACGRVVAGVQVSRDRLWFSSGHENRADVSVFVWKAGKSVS